MKVTLPRGIASISGTVSREKDGHKLIAKTFRKADGTTQTRMYWMAAQQRATPVTQREKANRARFAEANLFYQQLSEKDRKRYTKAMVKNGYMFNGKQYATLRGYIIARFFRNALL